MFTRCLVLTWTVISFGVASIASAVLIQPTDPQSHDVFLYQGVPTTNFNGPGFGGILGTGDSSGGGHDAESLIRFDFSALSEIPTGGKAFLNLYVTTSPGIPSVDPTDSLTNVNNVFVVNDAWDETTATWNSTRTLAGNLGSPVAQTTIGAVGKYYSFDVTDAVAAFISDPSSNKGFLLRSDAAFANGLGAVFFQSAGGVNRPFVEVTPEPSMLLALVPLVLGARVRKIGSR